MSHTRAFTILMLVTTSAAGILAADDKGKIPADSTRTTDKSEPRFLFPPTPFTLWPEKKEGHVVRCVGCFSASTELLAQYVKALRSDKAGDIILALTCLGWLDQHAESAIPAILPTLEHPSFKVRVEALECCGRIGCSDPKMLAKLLEKVKPMLASDDKQLKLAAIFCVSRLETPKYEHYRVALLIRSAKNNEQTKLTARNAVDYSVHIWFRFLVADALLSADPTDRTTALRLLQDMRSPAQRAIASAVSWRLLIAGNPHVRAEAAYCLASNSILPKLEMQALSALRRSSSSDIVRCGAVRGILLYENKLPLIAYCELALALADDSRDVREQAALISNFINRNRRAMGSQLSGPLVLLLNDRRPDVRRKALELLGWCQSAANEAVPSIVLSIMFDSDWNVKLTALNTLYEIAINQ